MKPITVGLVLAVGLGIALPMAISSFLEAPNPVTELPGPDKPVWLKTLVGQKLSLPKADAFGRQIASRGPRLLVALSCAGCSTKQYAASDFAGPQGYEPTILAFDARPQDVPAQFQDASYLRIVCYPETNELSPKTLVNLPQAFVVDATGVVMRVPGEGQSLEGFFNRP